MLQDFEELNQRVSEIQKETLTEHRIVILPDFFLDHFIHIQNEEKTFSDFKSVKNQKGGSITPITQRLQAGGNGANIAYHLAKLGMMPILICSTDLLGKHLLDYFFKDLQVDLTHLKTDGQLAMTAAIELGQTHTNIMLSDPGSVDGFCFEHLNEEDLELIAQADIVALLNWNNNSKATDLAEKLFTYAHSHNTTTFLDTGDPYSKIDEIPVLKQKILSSEKLDIFGLNENELAYYANSTFSTDEEMIHTAQQLKQSIPARIDLHTSELSASVNKHDSIVIPTIPTQQIQRITGAGDSWTAANLFATLLGFSDEQRLLFSNLYAHQYISTLEDSQLSLDNLQKKLNNLKTI